MPFQGTPRIDKSTFGIGTASAGLADYFGTSQHHSGLTFPTATAAFPFNFPGLFSSGLYHRPALIPPTAPIKGQSLLDFQKNPLPVLGNKDSQAFLKRLRKYSINGEETKSMLRQTEKEFHSEARNGVKTNDQSESSDLDDVSTPSGSELESTSGSELDSDAESDQDQERNQEKEKELEKKLTNSSVSQNSDPSSSNSNSAGKTSRTDVLLLSSSTVSGTVNDSIKAIASIAEKYFGSTGVAGLHNKKGDALTYPSMFRLPFFSGFSAPVHACNEREHDKIFSNKIDSVSLLHESHKRLQGSNTDSPFDLTTKCKERGIASNFSSKLDVNHLCSDNEDQPLDLSLGSRNRNSSIRDGESCNKPRFEEEITEMEPSKADSTIQHARPTPFFMDPIYRYYQS